MSYILVFLNKFYSITGFKRAREGTLRNKIHLLIRAAYIRYILKEGNSIKASHVRDGYYPFHEINKDSLRVLVLCGIGDVLWSFVLLPAVLKKYGKNSVDLVVHHNGDHRAGRSFEMLERFSFVNSVRPYSWPIHMDPSVDKCGHLAYTLTVGKACSREKLTFDYKLIINSFLERGWGFSDICEHLELSEDSINVDPFFHYREYKEDLIGVNHLNSLGVEYAVIYMGALSDNTTQGLNYQGLWAPEDWVNLIIKIYERTGYKLVLVGAPYDASYFAEVAKKFEGNLHGIVINTIGQYAMPATLSILKRARFVVGFASGVTISSVYLGAPTAIFWRPQHLSMSPLYKKFGFHESFSTDWVPPNILENRQYLDLWYTQDTPESIMERMEGAGWFDSAGECCAVAE